MLKLQHCSLVVRDIEKSKAFYCDFLGMTEVPRPPTFTFAGAWFRTQSAEIHIIDAAVTTAPAGFPPAGNAEKVGLATHLAFEVDDLTALIDRAKSRDIPIVGGPLARGDGVLQAYFHDPDRYLIELFQWVDTNVGGEERGAILA
jgi:catechol 2,3-dioxygenase-like lactoylglutathione lyase family enzyme